MTTRQLFCSFCARSRRQIKKLVAGPNDVYICDSCVTECVEILRGSADKDKLLVPKDKNRSMPTPRSIKEFLDQYVIGQYDAKEKLSVAVYNHYKRLAHPVIDGVEIDKSNLCLLGNTGCGKTLLCNTVARCLDVPLICYDMTSLTEAGFVGSDVEDIIARLLQAANYDVKKCESGIVFLDEIDKKRTRESAGSNSRDVSGEGVQQALLKLLEGTEIMVPSGTRRGPNVDTVKINTKNILFILGGAFVGLDKIVERDLGLGISVGFGAQIQKIESPAAYWLRRLEPQHLITYGMIPEIVGRIPVTAVLDDLDEDQLVDILTEPKNALVKQFVQMFALDHIALRFDDEALREIAKLARKRKTNGRGLRGVLESHLSKTQYELPDLHERGVEQVIFHGDCIVDNAEPEFVYTTKMAVVG